MGPLQVICLVGMYNIHTLELLEDLYYRTDSMHQASHTNLHCVYSMTLTYVSRSTALRQVLKNLKMKEKTSPGWGVLVHKTLVYTFCSTFNGFLSKWGYCSSPKKFPEGLFETYRYDWRDKFYRFVTVNSYPLKFKVKLTKWMLPFLVVQLTVLNHCCKLNSICRWFTSYMPSLKVAYQSFCI